MERADKIGLGVAVAGHVIVFGLLSVGFLSGPDIKPPETIPVDISLVDTVALDASAPPAPEPPAQSQAPEVAPPADAAPPTPAEPEPEPEPAPPPPPPVRQPPPAPAPKPVPKAPPRPPKQPVAEPKKPEKAPPAPARAAPARPAPARPATPRPAAAPAKVAVAKPSTGTRPAAPSRAPGGFKLSDKTLTGLSASPSQSRAETPPGATMNAAAAADIGSAIKRQVQPCADRQVNPGPGASRIVVTIRLNLARDGSLIGRPTVADAHGGVDDENRRYVDAVDRNAVATFMGCAPLRGLPPELYDVPRGWKTFSLRYKLPG